MLLHLLDVSLRSILMAAPAGIILRLLRRRVAPAWQHAVWSMVVCGILILLAFGQALPRLPLRVLDASAAPQGIETGVTADIAIVPPDGPTLPSPKPSNARLPIEWPDAAASVYAAIALGFLAWFFTGMLLARRVVKSASPVSLDDHANVFESQRLTVPATIGWLHPVVLLPPEWRGWPREKLDAVLAHEYAHVRRRDGLVAALAGINRCLFWFHPLAWMLERRVALLAEQACDECCVAALGDLRGYASVLLEMASVRAESQGRLRSHALTMAEGSHIRQRIESLLQDRRQDGRASSRGLTWSRWMALMLCGIPLVLCAGAVELAHQPPLLKLEIPRMSEPAPPALLPQKQAAQPIQLARSGKNPTAANADPQPKPDADSDDKLTFEVVSIKLAPPDDGRNVRRVTGDSSERSYENTTLYSLVMEAYPPPEFYKILGQILPDEPQHFNVNVKIPQGARSRNSKS
jgi:beta-lactamase regulating signal transducer with metallopeptidase domain